MEKSDAYKMLGLEPGTSSRQCKHKYIALKERTERLLEKCDGGQEQSLLRKQMQRLESAHEALSLGQVDISTDESNQNRTAKKRDGEQKDVAPTEPKRSKISFSFLGKSGESGEEDGLLPDDSSSETSGLENSASEEADHTIRSEEPQTKGGFSFTEAKKAVMEALIPIHREPRVEPKPIANNLKSDWKENKGPSRAQVSKRGLLIASIRAVAAVLVIATGAAVWKTFIHDPAIRQQEFTAMEHRIASLSEDASDEQIESMTARVRKYAVGARAEYAQKAVEGINERVAEIKRIREEKAAQVRADRRKHLESLALEIKELESKQEWLQKTAQETEEQAKKFVAMQSGAPQPAKVPYLNELNESFEEYRFWLGRFNREHPLHVSINDGKSYMSRGLLKQADLAVARGKRSTPALEEQISLQRMAIYGDRMIRWVTKPENQEAISWLKKDDAAVIAATVQNLKARLARLDNEPATPARMRQLERLGILVSTKDEDYQRWIGKVLPDLQIESTPSGARVVGFDGTLFGETPLTLENVAVGEHSFAIALKGYDFAKISFESELNADNETKFVELPKLSEPDIGQSYVAGLPGDVEMELAYIEGGSFRMGSPERERGRHKNEDLRNVRIDRGYWIGATEVTQGQWEALMGDDWRSAVQTTNGNRTGGFFGPNRPIHSITLQQAILFCERLTAHERQANRISKNFEFRIPTEEQWEYACRAGSSTPFHFGESLTSDLANFNGLFPYNSSVKTSRSEGLMSVGSYPANELGVYDMHGNVWEWTVAREGDDGALTDPRSRGTSGYMVRGGSWYSSGEFCRSAIRRAFATTARENTLGIRVVLHQVSGINVLEDIKQIAIDGQK